MPLPTSIYIDVLKVGNIYPLCFGFFNYSRNFDWLLCDLLLLLHFRFFFFLSTFVAESNFVVYVRLCFMFYTSSKRFLLLYICLIKRCPAMRTFKVWVKEFWEKQIQDIVYHRHKRTQGLSIKKKCLRSSLII